MDDRNMATSSSNTSVNTPCSLISSETGSDPVLSDNVVTWTMSGTFDDQVPILFDACNIARSLNRKQIVDLVEALSGSFPPGSTVCLHLPNDILYPVLFLSILASRCVWTGTNIAYTSHELEHHLRSTHASYVITADDCLNTAEAACKALGSSVEIILFEDLLLQPCNSSVRADSKYRRLSHLTTVSVKAPPSNRIPSLGGHMPAAIMSTSGTTGLPKMIRRSHTSLIEESRATEDYNIQKPYTIRRLYCTPIFHAFSFPEMMINSIRLGFPSYYMRRFDESFLSHVHNFNITETMAVPPILLRLSQLAEEKEENKLHLQSLRTILCAGAALSSGIRAGLLQQLHPSVRIVQVWGMSEGGWFTTFKFPEDDQTGSVGRAMAGYEVRCQSTVLDTDGRPIPSEVLVRSPHMPKSYLDSPAATAESFTAEGWLRTGDIGCIEKGKIYLVDRVKDMIKVNGWSVSPAELESALQHSPHVLDVAVVGHGLGVDEHPVAFVVLKDGLAQSSGDLAAHLLKHVARFKVSRCEFRVVNSIPRNPAGKTLRKLLRQQLD